MAEIKRTVTVFDQNTQEKTVIENVTANTFGELKSVLRAKGISLDGMDVREGISRVDLKSENALLPHDTPYRDGTTNDLMILLTKTNKKVSSGLGRKEAVQYIKDNNLADEVKKAFRKNWTNVSTEELVAFVNDRMSKGAPAAPKAPAKEADCDCKHEGLFDAFNTLVEMLHNSEYLDNEEYDELKSKLSCAKAEPVKEEPAKGFSQSEIYEAICNM